MAETQKQSIGKQKAIELADSQDEGRRVCRRDPTESTSEGMGHRYEI